MPDYVPDPEISQLVRDLNQAARGEVRREGGPGGPHDLDKLLRWAAGRGASDLLLVAGSEPAARIDGELTLVEGPLLSAEDLGEMVRSLLGPAALKRLAGSRSLDLGLERPGAGRFRCNLHYQRGTPALSIRVLPAGVPALEDLGLPETVAGLAELRRGLVLVVGPAGMGKSTTVAALLDRIAVRRACHIVTIEDPVEYRLEHRSALVEQIEVGRDTPSFAAALRASLRQSPDVIMVGEMRDLETIGIALTAAETGHLVLSTLHTGDASQAPDRVVDAFPEAERAQARVQLAGALRAILCQVLLAASGGGRVVASELLLATDAVRHRIRKGETHHLHQELTLGKAAGMQTLEESLASLVRAGRISAAAARPWARHPDELDKLLGGT